MEACNSTTHLAEINVFIMCVLHICFALLFDFFLTFFTSPLWLLVLLRCSEALPPSNAAALAVAVLKSAALTKQRWRRDPYCVVATQSLKVVAALFALKFICLTYVSVEMKTYGSFIVANNTNQ